MLGEDGARAVEEGWEEFGGGLARAVTRGAQLQLHAGPSVLAVAAPESEPWNPWASSDVSNFAVPAASGASQSFPGCHIGLDSSVSGSDQ